MSDKLQALIMHQYWCFCLTRSNVTIFKSGCFLVRKPFEMWPWKRQHVSPAICETSQNWRPQLELKTTPVLVLGPKEKEQAGVIHKSNLRCYYISMAQKEAIRSSSGKLHVVVIWTIRIHLDLPNARAGYYGLYLEVYPFANWHGQS